MIKTESWDAPLVHQMRSDSILSVNEIKVPILGGTRSISADIDLQCGESLMMMGPSGLGKSTFLHALMKNWHSSSGKVRIAKDALMVPQRPYFPAQSTLREAMAYPYSTSEFDEDRFASALDSVTLNRLVLQLDSQEDWNNILSGGEQQLLSLAKVFLKKPSLVLLDEPSAALNTKILEAAFTSLKKECKDCAFVVVSHDDRLKKYFQRVREFDADGILGSVT